VVILCTFILEISPSPPKTSEENIKLGDDSFIRRKYEEAENYYSDAIQGDSYNYMGFFKRASVYLETKKFRQALYDLNQVININPDFVRAYVRRAKLNVDLGMFEDVRKDLNIATKLKPDDKEASKLLKLAEEGEALYQDASSQSDPTVMRQLITKLLSIAPYMTKARLLSAQVELNHRQYNLVLEDTLSILKSEPNNLGAILVRGKAFKYLGESPVALNHFVQCLNIDPQNRECAAEKDGLSTFLRNFEAANEKVDKNPAEAINLLDQCIEYDANWEAMTPKLYLLKCKAYNKQSNGDLALQACGKVIELEEANVDAWMQRAEAKILKEDLEGAIRDYEKARELSPNNGQVQEGLRRANKLLKMAQRKDYYKILGVSKTANQKDIKRAYRSLALKHHPDKNPDNFEESSTKFKDITEAYDILSDEDKKGKYDRGEDLEERQGTGWNPFGAGGGFPGFTFHFGGR